MTADSGLPFSFPAIQRRRVTVAFDGGRLTLDGSVLLLGQVERRLVIVGQLASCIANLRDQSRVVHGFAARGAACAAGAIRLESDRDD